MMFGESLTFLILYERIKSLKNSS